MYFHNLEKNKTEPIVIKKVKFEKNVTTEKGVVKKEIPLKKMNYILV